MNWKQVILAYTHYLKIERGLSNNSIKSYQRDLNKLLYFIDNNKYTVLPTTITTQTIQEFIYQESKYISARSQARLLSALKSFFNYLVFEQYREENPTVLIETPKIGRKLPDTLSEDEIDTIINTIDLSQPQGERNRAIIETLYGCGLRVTELINLKKSDLFFNEGFIKITGKGNKQRFVPIAPITQKYIILYNTHKNSLSIQKGHEDFVFLNRRGKQLTRAMIFTIVKQLTETAGLKKQISPHTFRHSFATHLLKNGADLRAIQQMLGHESITTTEVYMHIDRSHLTEVLNKYHPRN